VRAIIFEILAAADLGRGANFHLILKRLRKCAWIFAFKLFGWPPLKPKLRRSVAFGARFAINKGCHSLFDNGSVDHQSVRVRVFCASRHLPEMERRAIQGDREAARQVAETADLYNRRMHEQLPTREFDSKPTYVTTS
jgi:hypothetical protein